MEQPIISKHIRIKAYRTPVLQELISYSKHSSRPKQATLDKLCDVWRSFPASEQSTYIHIPDMSTDISKYLNSTLATPNNTKKSLSPINRANSNKRIKPQVSSRRLMMSTRNVNKTYSKLSPETRNIAISINKHKLEEEESLLKPKYLAQQLPTSSPTSHKFECNCQISEICYQKLTSYSIGRSSVFLSCKQAASDLPSLLKNSIYAVLSLGEEPNHFPSIKGGYCMVEYEKGSYLKTFALASKFLASQLLKGNVLVHDETGNDAAVVICMAFILKETKVAYNSLLELIQKIRTKFKANIEQERFIRSYDHNKAGVVS